MIRPLIPEADHAAVTAFMAEMADYWRLADGTEPDAAEKATGYFTDCPPNCDPAASHRLGLFVENRLAGLIELSFGFPEAHAAYLGLMFISPRLRSLGHGAAFLAHAEALARAAGAPTLYLAVLQSNPRARAFWERNGFHPTGITRDDGRTVIHRLVKRL